MSSVRQGKAVEPPSGRSPEGAEATPEESGDGEVPLEHSRVQELVDALYRSDSRRILATLIRLLNDFDLAEDALQDAFRAALERWPSQGIPGNPRAWLISAGRFKALDAIRRRGRLEGAEQKIADELHPEKAGEGQEEGEIEDDRLRLMFTCCHPALGEEARVALTLREVCGLTTEEIARAFLTTPATLAQRIVRAKAKIRDARIPYQVPSAGELPERLSTVLQVVYLVFNEGYSASEGDQLMRPDLSGEAIRVGRLLVSLLPEPEAMGLLALMVLTESRRAARCSRDGELVLLEDQDKSLWDRELIAEGRALLARALASGQARSYTLQAVIAAAHAEAINGTSTNWGAIVGAYDALLRTHGSPVVELNRAVAVAMRDGASAGLALVEELLARGELEGYHLAHAARAELCRRLGKWREAKTAYERALGLVRQGAERRFLEKRLRQIKK